MSGLDVPLSVEALVHGLPWHVLLSAFGFACGSFALGLQLTRPWRWRR